MKVELNEVGKRFQLTWILRRLTLTLPPSSRWAVTGPNGSGKSTLLKMLSGHLSPSRGRITYRQAGKTLESWEVYREVAFAAPYIELIEEFTLSEALDFHQKFKPWAPGLENREVMRLLDFEKHAQQQIRFFSSGMKQRLKLALAFCSRASLVLLDEPTSNLDQQGTQWYLDLADRFLRDQTVIVASNVASDFRFCDQQLHVLDYKAGARPPSS